MSPRKATFVSLASTTVLYVVFWLIGEFGAATLSETYNESLLKLAVWVVPSLVLVTIWWKLTPGAALREIGLLANPLTGYAIGLLTAIPLAGLWAVVTFPALSPAEVAGTSLLGPVAEEVLFRGLLFRQLVRRGGRRPLWAMAVSAMAFGAAHLTRYVDIFDGRLTYVHGVLPYVAEFGLTAIGGLLFAWIVYRWDSLWPAIGVHSCLNLSWQLTINAAHITSFAATMSRMASVTIACYLTWRLTRTRLPRPHTLVNE